MQDEKSLDTMKKAVELNNRGLSMTLNKYLADNPDVTKADIEVWTGIKINPIKPPHTKGANLSPITLKKEGE
jgi:hypothetical protein